VTNPRGLWGCLTLMLLLAIAPLAAARKADEKEKADRTEARLLADREIFDMAVRNLASRLEKNKTDVALFLEENAGFSPTDPDFTLGAIAYADLSDVAKIQLALRAKEAAEKGTADLSLAALGKAFSLIEARESVGTGDRLEKLTGYLKLRKALDPKFDPLDSTKTKFAYKFPKPPDRPNLAADVRARIAVIAGYLSDPRNGGPTDALQRYFRKTPAQAQDLLWRCGSLRLALEVELARGDDAKETLDDLINRVSRDAKKRKDNTLDRVAILWPDREVKGGDELVVAGKAIPKQPEPPAAVMKVEDRAAEYKKYGDNAGSMKPADVFKRAGYPAGVYYSAAFKSEDLSTPAKVRYVADKSDPAKGKLVVLFKNMKTERSLLNVHAEDARAVWEMLNGKEALKDGDGVPLLGLEAGAGGNHYHITKTDVKRGQRRDVVVHPALLDTELAMACIRIEALAHTRNWLHEELAADAALGAKDSHARATFKELVEWAFDPWRNLDVFVGGRRQSVFRMVDVPMMIKPGVDDAALRVSRQGEDYDELLRGRAYVQMLLHVQQTKEDGSPKGEVEEVKKFAKETYPIMGDLLRSSPELQRLNNFAAVLAVARWAKSKGAEFAEPEKPKKGPRTPESVAVFSDTIVPLTRMKPEEIRKSEEKRIYDKMAELGKSAGVKKYNKAWEEWFEAAKNMEDATPAAEVQAKLEESDADVKMFEKLVRAVYADRVDELMRKHRGKDGKLNREKLRTDVDALINEVKKKVDKKPAEAGLALFILDEVKRRLPKTKDDA
jgi:hypothetical protein